MFKPYISATGITNPLGMNLNTSHSASMSIVSIECTSYNLNIGDSIDVYLGYEGNNQKVFSGYVKQVSKKVPDLTYTITAYDVLTRAVDFFIVSENPDSAFTRRNIKAEDLVEDLLSLAQLNDFHSHSTSFTFATRQEMQVNLVSVYDYCKMIADLLTWHLYADADGTVHFVNRKPHVMVGGSPESDQPHFVADTPIKTVDNSTILTLSHSKSEKDLRNRIVVYGADDVYGSASRHSSIDPDTGDYVTVLPANYYKSAVLATYIIDSDSTANNTAEYNLKLLNRLSSEVSMTVIGDPDLVARNVITINNPQLGINNYNYYIYSAEHVVSNSGYTVNMLLRK